MLHPPAGQIGNQHRHTAAGWCPSRCPWAAAGHSRASKQRRLPHQHTRHRPLLRAPRGPRSLAAVPVGAGGRGQDLAGLQNDADHPPAHQAPPVWRVPEGPEGLAGLRDRRLRAAGSRMEGTARPAWPAEPGRGAGGRRQSLARLRDRRLRAVGSRVAISRAAGPDGTRNTRGATSNKQHRKPGGPPPTGTQQHPTTKRGRDRFPATASSRSIGATHRSSGTASDQAVMSTWSSTAARPASRRATGTRNGEQDT